jgi:hypothetical protein
MKKTLLMSSVAAFLATGVVCAETAKADSGFKTTVKGKIGAAWYAALSSTVASKSVDGKFADNNQILLTDPKIYVLGDGGCSKVAYGYNVNFTSKDGNALVQNMYVYARLFDMVEFRLGRLEDAMKNATVDVSSVMGVTNGYLGAEWSSFSGAAPSEVKGALEKGLVLNSTSYTAGIDIRSVRIAGVQAVVNFKPHGSAQGWALHPNLQSNEAVRKGMFSAALNYDNTFGDFRIQGSIGGMFGLGTPRVNDKDMDDKDIKKSACYALGLMASWKGLDVAVGYMDNLNTGAIEATKDQVSGRAIHGGVGYQFDVSCKPRLALGTLFLMNGNGKSSAEEMSAKAGIFFANFQLTPRPGFNVFVEGGYDMYSAKLGAADATKFSDNSSFVLGSGFQVAQ